MVRITEEQFNRETANMRRKEEPMGTKKKAKKKKKKTKAKTKKKKKR